MSGSNQALETMLAHFGRSPDRSTMFWWLYEHHDALAERLGSNRVSWKGVCAQLAEMGLTDRNGGAPTPSTARKTWFRVRKAMEAKARDADHSAERPKAQFPIPRSGTVRPTLSAPETPCVPQELPAAVQTHRSDEVGQRPTPMPDIVEVAPPAIPASTVPAVPSTRMRPCDLPLDHPDYETPEQTAYIEMQLEKSRARFDRLDILHRL